MEQEQFVHIYDQREIICSETGKKEVAEMCEDEGGYMWEQCTGCGCHSWL
ncbi:hypothetical protein [Paenibacillus woosongensis]|uniref:Uncharacterized protein n=1 Tax=Paenibacillus woosongensis TaxID=307580 RepID=A0ABQ4MSP5_9BACL|nr:hypothetical protein [Paenibacillus woosongensis]GIP59013.1 hypothetical protein J15TS10_28270 [Paenibacillus woosongensis]